MDERLDVLDELGRPTGKVAWKSVAHRRGLWHRAFHCWISDGEYLLVQRRAPRKELWPGRLDVTAAGHLRAGEEVMDGLRELEEELGLRVEPERLVFLGTRRMVLREPGRFERELQEVYLLPDPTPPGSLRLQPEEVAAIVRLHLEAVERVFAGETVAGEEWRDGACREVPVRLEDFIPDGDAYTLRVARAARALASGELPGEIF